jgi:1,5-anhydro-D-fructose reductase (1,5-anhydro-D-mannitol-forming)
MSLRWALIGASDIAASRMVPAMRVLGHDVAVVCSADPERARAWAQSRNIARGTDSLDEALSDVDAVYISSTNDKHAAQARAAIQAGRHVLCEKPIALTVADALAMVDDARRVGVVLGTNHHLRNTPVHRRLRRLLQAGEIGQLLAVRVAHAVRLPKRLRGWRVDGSAPGSGVVLDITVHDMDTVRFVTGLEPRAVTAIGAAQGARNQDRANVVDAVMVAGRLDEDVLLQTHDAFTVEHAGTGFELHGTEGSLVAVDAMTQDPDGSITLHRSGTTIEIDIPDRDDLYVTGLGAFAAAAVRGASAPAATGEDGVRSLVAALAVADSLKTGRTVPVSDAGLPLATEA